VRRHPVAARKSLKADGAKVVSLNFVSWNQIGEWLKRLEAIREAA